VWFGDRQADRQIDDRIEERGGGTQKRMKGFTFQNKKIKEQFVFANFFCFLNHFFKNVLRAWDSISNHK
jgi:hypothetical protein